MEIDFLGLNSKKYPIQDKLEQENSRNDFTDSGDGISLSLGTATSNTFVSNLENSLALVPTDYLYHSSTAVGLRYALNEKLMNLRNASEITATSATFSSLCPTSANGSHETLKEIDNKILMAGKASNIPFSDAPKCARGGYTPTIAMARRASLARFLKKRSHRLEPKREPLLMGRPLNFTYSGACIKKKKQKQSSFSC